MSCSIRETNHWDPSKNQKATNIKFVKSHCRNNVLHSHWWCVFTLYISGSVCVFTIVICSINSHCLFRHVNTSLCVRVCGWVCTSEGRCYAVRAWSHGKYAASLHCFSKQWETVRKWVRHTMYGKSVCVWKRGIEKVCACVCVYVKCSRKDEKNMRVRGRKGKGEWSRENISSVWPSLAGR